MLPLIVLPLKTPASVQKVCAKKKFVRIFRSRPLRGFFSPALRWEPPYTGVSTAPSPEIPKKSQKGLPGPTGPECQKVSKDSRNTDFDTFLALFWVRLGLFRHFFDTSGGGGPGLGLWRLLYMAVPIVTPANIPQP